MSTKNASKVSKNAKMENTSTKSTYRVELAGPCTWATSANISNTKVMAADTTWTTNSLARDRLASDGSENVSRDTSYPMPTGEQLFVLELQ